MLGSHNIHMGRKKSSFICPKCKSKGYLRSKYSWNSVNEDAPIHENYYVVHYDHSTRKTKECYVSNDFRNWLLASYQGLSDEEFVSKMVAILADTQSQINKLFMKFKDSEPLMFNPKVNNIMLRLGKLLIEKESMINLLGLLSREVSTTYSDELIKLHSAYQESHIELLQIVKDFYANIKGLLKLFLRQCKFRFREQIKKLFMTVKVAILRSLQIGFYFRAAFILIAFHIHLKFNIPTWVRKRMELSKKLSEAAFGSNVYLGIIKSL